MKRLLSIVFLFGIMLSAFAQKSYVIVTTGAGPATNASSYYSSYNDKIYVSGSRPSSMDKEYKSNYNLDTLDKVFNELAKNGFTLETAVNQSMFIFSKPSNGSTTVTRSVKADPDEEVTEVARYNLQGVPVKANEKGVQVVVFSNYTTKTIIVE